MPGRLMNASSFDAAELDDGIRDVVVAMRNAGFDTWSSCQGGEGHLYRYPMVIVRIRESCDKERYLLSKWLLENRTRWQGTKIKIRILGRRLIKFDMVSKELNEKREFKTEI